MARTIPRKSKVGKVDRFFIGISAAWQGSAVISSATVVTADAAISIGSIDFGVSAPNEIGFVVTGVAEGSATVDIDYVLSDGRSDCKHVIINCIEC